MFKRSRRRGSHPFRAVSWERKKVFARSGSRTESLKFEAIQVRCSPISCRGDREASRTEMGQLRTTAAKTGARDGLFDHLIGARALVAGRSRLSGLGVVKERQQVAPGINASLGIGLRRAALGQQNVLQAFDARELEDAQ